MLTGCSNNQPDPKYPIGKDTVKAFGDATYQIQKNYKKEQELFKFPQQYLIDKNVYAYKDIGDSVYIWGAIGYTIINTKTYEIKQFRDFNGYSQEERKNYKFLYDGEISNLRILNQYDNFTQKEKKIFKNLRDSVKSKN